MKHFYLLFLISFVVATPPSLKNCGTNCFINATVQALYAIPALTKAVHNNALYFLSDSIAFSYSYLVTAISKKNYQKAHESFIERSRQYLKSTHNQQHDADELMGIIVSELTELDSLRNASNLGLHTMLKNILINTVNPFAICSNGAKNLPPESSAIVHLALPITNNAQPLLDILKKHFAKETIPMYVNNAPEDCTKITEWKEYPNTLILSLARYYTDEKTQISHKNDTPIIVTPTLDIQSFVQDQKNSGEYELCSAVIHKGVLDGGHYYAYTKDTTDNLWYLCNDTLIEKTTLTTEKLQQATIIIYQKKTQSISLPNSQSALAKALNIFEKALLDLKEILLKRS